MLYHYELNVNNEKNCPCNIIILSQNFPAFNVSICLPVNGWVGELQIMKMEQLNAIAVKRQKT